MMDDQRSKAWYEARLGKVTASRILDVTGATSERRKTYMMQLAAERLTQAPVDSGYMSDAMKRGVELEDVARSLFSLESGLEIEETGFHVDEFIPWLGASPDGFTSDGGLVEIKCPNTATHLTYCKERRLPAKYRGQVQCQLSVTGRSHAYFISFDDRLPERLQLLVVRVARDEAYIQEMREKVNCFLEELDEFIESITQGDING